MCDPTGTIGEHCYKTATPPVPSERPFPYISSGLQASTEFVMTTTLLPLRHTVHRLIGKLRQRRQCLPIPGGLLCMMQLYVVHHEPFFRFLFLCVCACVPFPSFLY